LKSGASEPTAIIHTSHEIVNKTSENSLISE